MGSFPTPRPAGNRSVAGLATEPLEKVRIGLIGLGMRGMGGLPRLLTVEGVEVTAVCDIVPERVAKAQQIVEEKTSKRPVGFDQGEEDWMNLCERDDVDLIYSCTPWELHTPNAVYAMKNGKIVESGTHKSLIRKKGYYYSLYTRNLL